MNRQTFEGCYFNFCKERGNVKRVGKITVENGRKYLDRALYFNTENGKYYVIVDGNAWSVKPRIDSQGLYYGWI